MKLAGPSEILITIRLNGVIIQKTVIFARSAYAFFPLLYSRM
jgi:hypothetical protein